MGECRWTWKPFASSAFTKSRGGATPAPRRWPTTYGTSARDGRSRQGPWAGQSDYGAGAGATRWPRRSWQRRWLWLGWRAAAACGYFSSGLTGAWRWLG